MNRIVKRRSIEREKSPAARELQRWVDEFQALHGISQTILESADLNVMMSRILDKAMETAGFEIGMIQLLNPDRRTLEPVASRGYRDPKNVNRQRRRAQDPSSPRIVAQVIETMTTKVEDLAHVKGMRTFRREGVRTMVTVPLRTREDVLGVIHLGSRTQRDIASKLVRFLEAIGTQTGIAVQKIRLFEAIARRAKEQETLNIIAAACSRSLDLKELFEIIADKTVEVTGRQRINLRLKDPRTHEVNIVAYRGFSEAEIETLRRIIPHPMSGRVFTSGNPLVINDRPGIESAHLLARTRSVAWIPVKAGARVIGVLGISDDQSRPFLPSEAQFLQAIANVIGVAIENARLFDETKRNLDQIRILHEIGTAIISTLNLHDLLAIFLEKVDHVLPYSASSVRLFNSKTGLLEPVASRNLDDRGWKAEQWRGGRGMPKAVFESKAPLIVPNLLSDPRLRDTEFFRKQGLISYLGAPLMVREEILGVLSFYTKEEREFTSQEVDFLSTLASQAAIAIHNARLFQRTKDQAVQLERANKGKDEFLSVMSHELRTPLNVISGYAEMVRRGMFGEINAAQDIALAKVIGCSKDLLGMISRILRATRIDAEAVDVEKNEVAVCSLMDELKSVYDGTLRKELSLHWDYPREFPSVKTDSEALKHILHNLINNAIKFTDKGGVTVSARPLPGAKKMEFQVADSGIGIPQEMLPLIFEKFRQADGSATRAYGGSHWDFTS